MDSKEDTLNDEQAYEPFALLLHNLIMTCACTVKQLLAKETHEALQAIFQECKLKIKGKK